jgi:hypothetical protein
MLHACLCTICFVFCYTSWCFYEFSRTNLLTRCHSASSCFLLFLCFRKATQEIFLELDETKGEAPIFSTRDRVQSRDGGGPGASHLAHLLTPPFRLYILLDEENLKSRSIFHKIYYKPPPSSTRDREGPEALPGTLPERGITTGGLLHHHACLRSDVRVVYLGLRVHSSS